MTVKRLLLYVALVVLAAYGAITSYPGILFSASRGYNNITLYSRLPLNELTDKLLARVYDALAAEEFFDPGRKLEIYLTGGYGEYRFFAPFCGRSYSCAHPVSNKVFIASADPGKDLAYDPSGRGAPRILESVMVHELAKAQVKNKLGALKYLAAADWKKDGYAEHLARETGDMNSADICGEWNRNDLLKRYLEYRLMAELLKYEDGIGYAALMTENISYESVRTRVLNKYCKRL
ncbi:MAG: hypothetical protein A2X28_03690 [Elusimicrobia bacterium GWA2_56_46]|nr:MAG: hypothetical protein A2X28_03690 [Elusimicrobia bacterium GWA2_56_46]OGR54977.1 MAG: hypothetical protein A2X39_02625 [Elusimicrobia bacterium GWC2_56_31]HBB67790.1 hypothetical protein [Elusimicrobiota bacterium]HBW24013.1 hypothetical protein [Elusimicrobiota bacterium]